MSRALDKLTPVQRRIRAAAVAAGLSLESLAEELPEYGNSPKRIASIGGAGPKDAKPTHERLAAIAAACGCPIEWLEGGWGAVAPKPPEGDRLDLLERDVARLRQLLESDPDSRPGRR